MWRVIAVFPRGAVRRDSMIVSRLWSWGLGGLMAVGMAGVWSGARGANRPAPPHPATPAAAKKGAAPRVERIRPPLAFEENQGQTDRSARYLSRGADYTLFLTPTEAVLALHEKSEARNQRSESLERSRRRSSPARLRTLAMRLKGANPAPRLGAEERLPGVSHYLRGGDPSRWQRNVPHYRRVRYEQVYPGIDLVYYGREGQLEYDFVVAPGADPDRIALAFRGATGARVDGGGDLLLETDGGIVRQKRPVCYQTAGGRRVPVAGRYVLAGCAGGRGETGVRFELGRYDRSRPLVIDPVIAFSTYHGGRSSDVARGVAAGDDGSLYVTGATYSTNFPTTDPYQATLRGDRDAFVSKLDPSGSTLLYSTYLGGTSDDAAMAVAVDQSGSATVVGWTYSSSFPNRGGAQPAYKGGSDAFVARLTPGGNDLVYSTFLGGRSEERAYAVALAADGDAWVTGSTASPDLPVFNPLIATLRGYIDAFVTRVQSDGTGFAYSSYLGGRDYEYGIDIAVDGQSRAVVTGYTYSDNFPISNAYQRTRKGSGDVFLTRLSESGLASSTYFGGSDHESGNSVAIGADGAIYLAGATRSRDFPVLNAVQRSAAPQYGYDVFVTAFSSDALSLVYSTYLGGALEDIATSVAVDRSGSAYVAGYTQSANFPVQDPIQGTRSGSEFDAFVARLAPGGDSLLYSTYLGGTQGDYAYGIAVTEERRAYIVGETTSTNFPVLNARQPTIGAGPDGFVTAIYGIDAPSNPYWTDGPASPIVSLRATWTPPTFVGPGLRNYRIQVKEDSRNLSTGPYVVEMDLPATAVRKTFTNLNGLRAGHWYAFRIRAVSTDDVVGPWSKVSQLSAVAMGSISGRVTRNDGVAVNGATVEALVRGTTTVARRVTTDRVGRFILPALAQGSYDIRVTHSDTSRATFTNSGAGYTVTPNAVTTVNVEVRALVLGSIYGVAIRASDTAPIGNVVVRAYRWGTNTLLASSITAYNGLYVLPRVLVGNARLEFTSGGFHPLVLTSPIAVTAGASSRQDVALELDDTDVPWTGNGSITGLTTLSDGVTPLPNVRIAVLKPVTRVVYSDMQGRFVLPELPQIFPPSYCRFNFSKEGYQGSTYDVEVHAGYNAVWNLRLHPLATIEGRILVGSVAGNGVSVTAQNSANSFVATSVAGADGRYRLIVPGLIVLPPYTVSARYLAEQQHQRYVAPGGTVTVNFTF
jgi:hypothetical protein